MDGAMYCVGSTHDLEGLHLTPIGVVGLAADPFVGADTDVIGGVLLQSGADRTGALVALEGHGLAASEVLAGAILELVAIDLAVPVPISLQFPSLPIVHRSEGGALGVDGDGDLLGGLGTARGGGDGDGGLAHEVLCDGHLAVFVHLHRLVI